MLFVYRLAIQLYHWGIQLAAFFSPKAQMWVAGRKGIWERLNKIAKDQDIIWIHCASLGEFEQGRPLIESLKKQYPQCKIFLSFFSPSGYEIRKNYPLADYVDYLPVDTKRNAEKWIECLQPRLVVFVKYEFWYYYLATLHHKGIPCFLISAIFRSDQSFFKPYGGLFRKMLFHFKHIFVQNERSAKLLRDIGIKNLTISGDTRIDRVLEIPRHAKTFPLVANFAEGHPVVVLGSTWEADEKVFLPILNNNAATSTKFIIAPHEINPTKITALESQLRLKVCRYSQAQPATIADYQVLIIDNIGMLSALYQYGQIAYIGGGFGKGIHNTLEPIAFGLPVIFGPKYEKFEEAIRLIERQAAFSIKQSEDLVERLAWLRKPENYRAASEQAKLFLQENQGATQQIMLEIQATLERPR
ncbi:MAG: 3-deoxy-D-manno-octulosonic acid transferase [Saprospiraceae bacterium]